MDSFPRPELGTAIFFEYLRTDDPFSADFLERVVDGFPHLLGPLAQVQGVTSSAMQQPASPPKHIGSAQLLLKSLGSAADSVTSHTVGAVGAIQHAMQEGAAGAAANAAQAAQSAGDVMRHLGEEAERKRVATWRGMVAMSQQNPTEVISQFATRAKENPSEFFAQIAAKIKGARQEELPVEEEEPEVDDKDVAPHGRVFRSTTSQWFGETLETTDEIAPILHPTMNKTILSLVHMYLLLILIVSFPATNTSRTRFVVRRSSKLISVSSSEGSLLRYGQESNISPSCAKKPSQLISSKNGFRREKTAAREPRLLSEEKHDPTSEGNGGPQKIRIDLSSFESADAKARIYPGTNGNGSKNGSCSSQQGNDNLQKSLSYFL